MIQYLMLLVIFLLYQISFRQFLQYITELRQQPPLIIIIVVINKMMSLSIESISSPPLYAMQKKLIKLWSHKQVNESYKQSFLKFLDTLPEEAAILQITDEYKKTLDNTSLYNKIEMVRLSREKVLNKLKQNLIDQSDISSACDYIKKLRECNLKLCNSIIKLQIYFKSKTKIQQNKSIFVGYVKVLEAIDEDNDIVRNSYLRDYLIFGKSYDPFLIIPNQFIQKNKNIKEQIPKCVLSAFYISISQAYKLMTIKNQILDYLANNQEDNDSQHSSRDEVQANQREYDPRRNKKRPLSKVIQQNDEIQDNNKRINQTEALETQKINYVRLKSALSKKEEIQQSTRLPKISSNHSVSSKITIKNNQDSKKKQSKEARKKVDGIEVYRKKVLETSKKFKANSLSPKHQSLPQNSHNFRAQQLDREGDYELYSEEYGQQFNDSPYNLRKKLSSISPSLEKQKKYSLQSKIKAPIDGEQSFRTPRDHKYKLRKVIPMSQESLAKQEILKNEHKKNIKYLKKKSNRKPNSYLMRQTILNQSEQEYYQSHMKMPNSYSKDNNSRMNKHKINLNHKQKINKPYYQSNRLQNYSEEFSRPRLPGSISRVNQFFPKYSSNKSENSRQRNLSPHNFSKYKKRHTDQNNKRGSKDRLNSIQKYKLPINTIFKQKQQSNKRFIKQDSGLDEQQMEDSIKDRTEDNFSSDFQEQSSNQQQISNKPPLHTIQQPRYLLDFQNNKQRAKNQFKKTNPDKQYAQQTEQYHGNSNYKKYPQHDRNIEEQNKKHRAQNYHKSPIISNQEYQYKYKPTQKGERRQIQCFSHSQQSSEPQKRQSPQAYSTVNNRYKNFEKNILYSKPQQYSQSPIKVQKQSRSKQQNSNIIENQQLKNMDKKNRRNKNEEQNLGQNNTRDNNSDIDNPQCLQQQTPNYDSQQKHMDKNFQNLDEYRNSINKNLYNKQDHVHLKKGSIDRDDINNHGNEKLDQRSQVAHNPNEDNNLPQNRFSQNNKNERNVSENKDNINYRQDGSSQKDIRGKNEKNMEPLNQVSKDKQINKNREENSKNIYNSLKKENDSDQNSLKNNLNKNQINRNIKGQILEQNKNSNNNENNNCNENRKEDGNKKNNDNRKDNNNQNDKDDENGKNKSKGNENNNENENNNGNENNNDNEKDNNNDKNDGSDEKGNDKNNQKQKENGYDKKSEKDNKNDKNKDRDEKDKNRDREDNYKEEQKDKKNQSDKNKLINNSKKSHKKQIQMRPCDMNINQLRQFIKNQSIKPQNRIIFQEGNWFENLETNHCYLTQFQEKCGEQMTLIAFGICTQITNSVNYRILYWGVSQEVTDKVGQFIFRKYLQYLQKYSGLNTIRISVSPLNIKHFKESGFDQINSNQIQRKRLSITQKIRKQQFLTIQCANIVVKKSQEQTTFFSEEIQSFSVKNYHVNKQIAFCINQSLSSQIKQFQYIQGNLTIKDANQKLESKEIDTFQIDPNVEMNVNVSRLCFLKTNISLKPDFFTYKEYIITKGQLIISDTHIMAKTFSSDNRYKFFFGKNFDNTQKFINFCQLNNQSTQKHQYFGVRMFSKQLYGRLHESIQSQRLYGNWFFSFCWENQLKGIIQKDCPQDKYLFGKENYYMGIFYGNNLLYAFEIIQTDFFL